MREFEVKSKIVRNSALFNGWKSKMLFLAQINLRHVSLLHGENLVKQGEQFPGLYFLARYKIRILVSTD